jgi:hypothetical protein
MMTWSAFEIVRIVLYGLELLSGMVVFGNVARICGTAFESCSGTF